MALRWACRQLGRRREAVLVVAARCVSVRSLVGGASESFANSQPSVRWCTGGWSNFLGKVRSSEVGGGGGGTRTRAEMGEDAWCAGTVEVWWCSENWGGKYYIGWRQKMAGAGGGSG